jgi:DNA-binding FadR family transcriptional regulator
MTNEIYPLHRYLIDIIYTGDDPKVKQIIRQYLTNELTRTNI